MPNLRGSEWLIIILLLVLLFGAKRLPDAARSMGRSLRIFKAETKGLVEETPPGGSAAGQGPAPVTQPTPAPIAPAVTPAVPPAPTQSAPTQSAPTQSATGAQAAGALSPQPPTQT